MQKIVFTGGGSAGHTVPNLAIIQELKRTGKYDLYYFGTNGIERELVTPMKLPFFTFDAPKLKRGVSMDAFKNNLTIPCRFLTAVKKATDALQDVRPDLVFSKGGYVALPVVFAAHKLGIPCITHESDLSMGLANRLAKGKCKLILTAFPETAEGVKGGVYCGQPIRSELFGISRPAARKQLAEGTARKIILIFGGGSGSAAINEAVRKYAPTLCKRYYILHVCGKGNVMDSRLSHYRQFEFIKDMGAAYAAADLVISRAGAGAVFETIALKKPAIFIPLEGQTRGDQWENASYFSNKGLCYLLPQTRLNELCETVDSALADEALRKNLLLSPYSSGTKSVVQAMEDTLNSHDRLPPAHIPH